VTIEEFGGLFARFESDAFRLELLPAYRVPEEEAEFADFLHGAPLSRRRNGDWPSVISAGVSSGKTMRRARALSSPPTPYQRYELEWCYPYSVDAGEHIRVIRPDEFIAVAGDLPTDFWMFDERLVIRMLYAADGIFLGVEEVPATDVSRYVSLANQLWPLGEPLSIYLSRSRSGNTH
jgi:hypothetical protein